MSRFVSSNIVDAYNYPPIGSKIIILTNFDFANGVGKVFAEKLQLRAWHKFNSVCGT